jgi:hypothetical protein
MRIAVKSPRTLRTYSDASQIAEVLINLSLSKPKALFLDSGGILISLGDLARNISRFYPGSRVEFEKGELQSPNYFGDFKSFNQLVDGFDLRMLTIGEQIQNSIKAFH